VKRIPATGVNVAYDWGIPNRTLVQNKVKKRIPLL